MLFILLLPFYKQVFDVDGIGYSLVAQHLAHGNFAVQLTVSGVLYIPGLLLLL